MLPQMVRDSGFKSLLEVVSVVAGMISVYVLMQVTIVATQIVDDHSKDESAHASTVAVIKDQIAQEREARISALNQFELIKKDIEHSNSTFAMMQENSQADNEVMLKLLREIQAEIKENNGQ